MSDTNPTQIHATGEATGFISAPGDKGKPITVIGTNSIRAGFDATCLQQALNARSAPGVVNQTPFATTGHPILLPGNPAAGSVIMVADAGAERSAYSVNHGAGRCMGRKA